MASMTFPYTGILAGVIGPWQIVIILVAVLILFGGRRIPELARGLGKGLRLFKAELRGIEKDIEETEEPKRPNKCEESDEA